VVVVAVGVRVGVLGGVIGASFGPIFIFNGGVLSLVAEDEAANVAPTRGAAVGVTAEAIDNADSSDEDKAEDCAWKSPSSAGVLSRSPSLWSLWSLPWSATEGAKKWKLGAATGFRSKPDCSSWEGITRVDLRFDGEGGKAIII
jgi:hypothetical protein